MKHFAKKTVPARTEDVQTHITCDFCSKEIKRKSFETNDVNIDFREGQDFPEGGSGEDTSFDCCGECFKVKVLPALTAMAVTGPTVKEYDW